MESHGIITDVKLGLINDSMGISIYVDSVYGESVHCKYLRYRDAKVHADSDSTLDYIQDLLKQANVTDTDDLVGKRVKFVDHTRHICNRCYVVILNEDKKFDHLKHILFNDHFVLYKNGMLNHNSGDRMTCYSKYEQDIKDENFDELYEKEFKRYFKNAKDAAYQIGEWYKNSKSLYDEIEDYAIDTTVGYLEKREKNGHAKSMG